MRLDFRGEDLRNIVEDAVERRMPPTPKPDETAAKKEAELLARVAELEQRLQNEVVACYDAKSGAPIWSFETPGRFFESLGGLGPRGTPTLADGSIYALGAEGLLERSENALVGPQPRIRHRELVGELGRDVFRDGMSLQECAEG